MNKYQRIGNSTMLSDAAADRIYKNLIAANHAYKREQSKKGRTAANRIFRLSAICASAAIVCGTAIGTGIYLGNRGDKDVDLSEVDLPEYTQYYCYYMGYELEEYEQDIDNFNMNLYYGFDEQAVRGRYNQVLEEAERRGFGEVLKYEIILKAMTGNRNDEGFNDKVVLNRWEINDINKFPFDDYRVNVVEENGEVVERIYTHSEKIIVPEELLALNDDTFFCIYMHERIEYEIGDVYFKPPTIDVTHYWSEDGKVANDYGYAPRFFPVNNNVAGFFYKLENGKVLIDKTQFDEYEYTVDMGDGRNITMVVLPDFAENNAKPIYR